MENCDTAKLLAAKFPNVSVDWLRQVDKELGTCNGNARLTVQFSGYEPQWTDWTKRILGKLRPGRSQK